MFINEYQGGSYFEVFNPSSKDSLNNFKITGSHSIQKIYDKDVKGSVFQLDGTPSTTKLTLPKNSRDHLSLIQRCIVFQLYVKNNHEISIELVITDLGKNRRNLLFSTAHKELNIQPLSARIPIKCINRDQWTNFVIDVAFLINELWKNQTFKTIDAISICANCKLRRVFTLKSIPNPEIGLSSEESLISIDFPEDTNTKIQLYNPNECKSNNENTISTTPSTNKKSTSNLGTKSQNVFNIAFGSKFRGQTPISQSRQLKSAKSQPQIISNEVNRLKKDRKTQLPVQSSTEHLENSNIFVTKKETSPPSNEKKHATKSSLNQSTNTNPRETKNIKDFNGDLSLESSLSKNLNKIESIATEGKAILETNKIPHPPSQPKSTRPTSTSARKMRLQNTSAVKNNQQKQSLPKGSPSITKQKSTICNGESSNEDDMQNSSKTLVGISPVKNTAPELQKDEGRKYVSNVNKLNSYLNQVNTSVNKTEDLMDLINTLKVENQNNKNQINKENVIESVRNLPSPQQNGTIKIESSNVNQNVSYSFSSRPKPAPFINGHQNEVSKTNKEAYDHRRYGAPSLFKNFEKPNENSNHQHQYNKEVIPWKTAIAHDSLNVYEMNYTDQNNFEIMDSFEANMLRELKEEMAFNANSNSHGKNTDTGSKKNDSGFDSKGSKVSSTNSNNSDIKRDVEYTIQRDNSGIQSSCSDEYNQTSEKYNFDLITSSIDETTASLSKKTPSRITKYENNNYQDEMNFSLQIQSKSINLKDLPSKYSPLLSQQNGANSNFQNNPITEEHLDDSQADIDSDSEDEVDLLYDPALDCYYDPKTSTYYALNMD